MADQRIDDLLVGIVLGCLLADREFRKRFDPRIIPHYQKGQACSEVANAKGYECLRGLLRSRGVEWEGKDEGSPLRAVLERIRQEAAGEWLQGCKRLWDHGRDDWDYPRLRQQLDEVTKRYDNLMSLDLERMANGDTDAND